jgi:hypothetical protein
MTIKITTPNGGADSLDFGCARTAIVATVTGTEVSSGEGKLELKTTTGGTSAAKMTINGAGLATFTGATTTAGTVTASGDMKFNSGYGSAVVAYGCRAWVNFNGTGTVAIREDGNVSSITDHGTGDYTMNFAVNMPDVNYAICGTTVGTTDTYYNQIFGHTNSALAVGSTRFRTANSVDPSSPQDSTHNHVVIFR